MRHVEAAALRPHHCAAVPFSGMHSPGGFIDTGIDLPGWDPHVYISVAWLNEAVRFLGWPTPAEASELGQQLASVRAELERTQAELADKTAALDAVQVLKGHGYTPARKPGRPATKGKVAA